jgi:hypothetical protein
MNMFMDKLNSAMKYDKKKSRKIKKIVNLEDERHRE